MGCQGIGQWDKPLILQSCRLTDCPVLLEHENVLITETQPEKGGRVPFPADEELGLAQSD